MPTSKLQLDKQKTLPEMENTNDEYGYQNYESDDEGKLVCSFKTNLS